MKCIVENCDSEKKKWDSKYCIMHRGRVYRYGDPNFVKVKRHGYGYKDPEYASWHSMKSRCLNLNDKAYKHYGGRGIKVTDRWLGVEGFTNFLSDMGFRPSSKHSIERKDVNGNYEPNNCEWATIIVQANNRRSNHRIEYNGMSHTLIEWSRILDINRGTLTSRIIDSKWSIEKALTTPVRGTQ